MTVATRVAKDKEAPPICKSAEPPVPFRVGLSSDIRGRGGFRTRGNYTLVAAALPPMGIFVSRPSQPFLPHDTLSAEGESCFNAPHSVERRRPVRLRRGDRHVWFLGRSDLAHHLIETTVPHSWQQ